MRATLVIAPALISTLAACGESGLLIAYGELPSDAESFVLALEQDELHALYAHPADGEPLRFGLPVPFSEEQPISLTRIAFRESLEELGLQGSGPLTSSPAPRQALGSLERLAVENASIFSVDEGTRFETGTASDWILEHFVPRPERCVSRVRDEVLIDSRPPRDLVVARSDLAVGLSLDAIHLVAADGSVRSFPFQGTEYGRSLGLGAAGRVWVATSSRAGVLDESTGSLIEAFALSADIVSIGIAEDPVRGDLYLFSAGEAARLYRRRAGASALELFYDVPVEFVRIAGLHKQLARFVFTQEGRLVIASDDVSTVLEVEGEEVRLLMGDPVGSGFSSVSATPRGTLLLTESAFGDVYEYRPGRLERVGGATTKIIGMLPLDALGERYAYLTQAALFGTFELPDEVSCQEVPVAGWAGAYTMLKFGDRILGGGNVGASTWGFRWLEPEE